MKGIKFISLWEPSGYGEAARRYIKALERSGIALTWCPLVPGPAWGLWYEPFAGSTVGDPELDHLCNKSIEYDTVIAHVVPEYFPLCRQAELRTPAGRHARIFGYTVWETTVIPDHWLPLLNSVDGLLVPTEWNAQVFRDCGVSVPVSVVPHISCQPVDSDTQFAAVVRPKDFVFYSINTWTERKACWLTVRAYQNAFTADDPVVLVLKTSRDAISSPSGFFRRSVLRRRYLNTRAVLDRILREYQKPARVILVTDEISSEQIAALHRRGDCYLSLCRTEGWGIGAFDACTFGNPVVMTGFGGQLEYLGADNPLLIDFELVPVKDRNKSYSSNQHWAEPDICNASALIRSVFENPATARDSAKRLQTDIGRRFSEDGVAKMLINSVSLDDAGTGSGYSINQYAVKR